MVQQPSKKIRRFDCVVKTVICGHRLVPLLLFLKWPACSVFSDEFRRAPVRLRRASSGCFCSVFSVFLLFLGIAGLFYVFSASVKAPTKLCIFRQVSGDTPAKFPVAVFRRILLVNHEKKIVVCCW
jgi:hypothetical protein